MKLLLCIFIELTTYYTSSFGIVITLIVIFFFNVNIMLKYMYN